MVRDHNTRFHKFLAGIGKRFFWWKQPKINGLFMCMSFLEDLRVLVDINGSLEKALEDFREIGKIAGHDLLYEMLDVGKMIFSKSLEDVPLFLRVSWYVLMGENLEEKYIRYIPKGAEGNEYDMAIISFEQCLFCAGLDSEKELIINKETMGSQTYGSVVAGVLEAAIQTIMDYVENDYVVKVQETKCIMKGDLHPEYTLWFVPR
ncbi:MAG: hypothetical protein ACTSVY_08125 [Candidatus Helarchaeota archaeon]